MESMNPIFISFVMTSLVSTSRASESSLTVIASLKVTALTAGRPSSGSIATSSTSSGGFSSGGGGGGFSTASRGGGPGAGGSSSTTGGAGFGSFGGAFLTLALGLGFTAAFAAFLAFGGAFFAGFGGGAANCFRSASARASSIVLMWFLTVAPSSFKASMRTLLDSPVSLANS